MANRALLVGINAYKDSPLRGCLNDIMDLRDLLTSRYGFAASDIRVLVDAEATTANIRQQLGGWLVRGATPDRMLFHFSGHGTQMPGRDGSVHDVICPVDFDFTEEHALSDVDFSAIFSAIPAGAQFNWISDSCHSGDLARALGKPQAIPRYLPPPPEIAAEIEHLLKHGGTKRSLNGPIERLKGVLIAGCRSNETSADAIFDERSNGALSYYLLRELAASDGESKDIDTVVRNVQRALTESGYEQHPQVRGLLERRQRPFMAALSCAKVVGEPEPIEAPHEGTNRAVFSREGDGQLWDDSFEEVGHPDVVARGDEGWSKVQWVKNDEESTEYRHIAKSPHKGATFDFSPDHLELLISVNAFEPVRDRGKIIFALRGAELVAANGASGDDKFRQVGRPTLRLRETRPNHQHFLCVIGVYDTALRLLSGYIASTVPCRQAVYNYANGGAASNMLPTGCYRLIVGTHNGRLGCLTENEDFTVLRTTKDYVYDTKDTWENTFPGDNLHPAFANSSAQFSSWGCQTVRGNCPKGTDNFSGEYKEFRHELGLLKPGTGDYGLKFSYVMLTGLEAAMAHNSPDRARTELVRLRHGSCGDRVRALQQKLGLSVDGIFAAKLKKALAEHQRKELGWADGIYGPEMDALLKFDIFAASPVAVASAAPVTALASADRGLATAVNVATAATKSSLPWRTLILIAVMLIGVGILMLSPAVRSAALKVFGA